MTYQFDPAKQQFAAERFGRMLQRWRVLNGWTQYTAYKWGKEAGFAVMAPSTLSVFENAKAPKPRLESFFALGEINRRLAMKDFSGLTTQALKELVEAAEPLKGEGGRVWTPTDFWSCHAGLLAVPKAYVE